MTDKDREQQRALYENLCAALTDTIETSTPPIDLKQNLTEQAAILDAAFRQIMARGLLSLDPNEHFAHAFKAQNQYRQTIDTMQKLENQNKKCANKLKKRLKRQ